MPKTLKEDIFTTWTIDGDNATWTMKKQAMIDVNDIPAIEVLGTSTGNRLDIAGRILATDDFGVGIDVDGADTRIVIDKTAHIDATQGINGSASGLRIVNNGEIEGGDHGIESAEKMNLRNNGEITGDYAIRASDNGKIINGKHGDIDGHTVGIVGSSGANSVIINHGTISGVTWALSIGGGDDNRLINTGTINGNVQYFEGNDLIDTRKGKINGDVYGGEGNDVYKIGKHDIDITEYANDGLDRVYSTVSHTLTDNIETLYLIGKKDTSGLGNDDDNFIRGNKGDNTMSGGLGDDYVGGGAGNDMLIGETGDDFFMFNRGDDKDTIADFVQGEDLIWMTGFKSMGNFVEVQSRMSQHGDDTWINMGKGDRLIIENVDKDDLVDDDFSFYEFA